MSKKALVLIILIIAGLLCFPGCKKSSPESRPADEAVESAVDYAEEAAEEIDTEDMADELDRIEAEMEQEEVELP